MTMLAGDRILEEEHQARALNFDDKFWNGINPVSSPIFSSSHCRLSRARKYSSTPRLSIVIASANSRAKHSSGSKSALSRQLLMATTFSIGTPRLTSVAELMSTQKAQ